MLRAVVLGAMGLLVAAFAVVAYVSMRPPAAAQAEAPKLVTVLVAARPVRAGTLLQPADLMGHDLPETMLPEGAPRDTPEMRAALVGAMARRSLDANAAIGAADVLRPGDRGFLAAVLSPGMRAVSVAVDNVSGEAGLIWPGDRVDVLLTQTIEAVDTAPGHHVSGEVVMNDVRVIAVDQQLVQGGQASGLLDGKSPASRTITLEVSSRDAARVAVATRLGKLQVVVRSADGVNPSVAQSVEPVWGGDVSAALRGGPSSTVAVKVFSGTKPGEEYKF